MKKPLLISIVLSIFIASADLNAQDKKANTPMNYFKFNLTSAILNNYSFQYERVLTRGMTLSVGYRIMPESGLPYYSTLNKIVKNSMDDGTGIEDEINLQNLTTSNFAVTPELRFYMGKKKFGRGFYFSLFYRYSQFEAGNIQIPFEGTMEQEITLNAGGELKAHTAGFMFGSQWALGKHICLDWWLLGPHAGMSKTDFNVTTSYPLSEADQQEIRDGIDDVDFPMLEKNITVSADGIRGKIESPFAGIRSGISLGIRF